MNKQIALAIIALMSLSFIAASLALAEESTSITANNAEETPTEVVNSVIAETNEAASDTDERFIGFSQVTLGSGWVVKSDGTQAEFARGIWQHKKFISVSSDKLKELRENSKGDKQKVSDEARKLSTKTEDRVFGRFDIGTGRSMEKFKLVKKDITNDTASFYVVPINEKFRENDSEAVKNSVGTLELSKKQYPNLALWTGKLVLNSGNLAGEWSVSIASRAMILKQGTQIQDKEKEDKSVNSNSGEKIKKTSFLRKLMFWKKDKAE